MLPAAPVMKPTAGPNMKPKKAGKTAAGRSVTWLTEGSVNVCPLNIHPNTP
jgi:hypothetical protein